MFNNESYGDRVIRDVRSIYVLGNLDAVNIYPVSLN